jgi:hypothetical protein
MAEEVEQDIDSPTNWAGDSVLHRENDQDDEHESEEIAEETVNDTTPRRRTQEHLTFQTQQVPRMIQSVNH